MLTIFTLINLDFGSIPTLKWEINPPEQPDLELTLIPIDEKMMFDKESAAQMRALVSAGTFGFGTFECDDILATYEELKAKGVHFKKEPAKEFYGFSAVFQDDSGNWFSLGQKKQEA